MSRGVAASEDVVHLARVVPALAVHTPVPRIDDRRRAPGGRGSRRDSFEIRRRGMAAVARQEYRRGARPRNVRAVQERLPADGTALGPGCTTRMGPLRQMVSLPAHVRAAPPSSTPGRPPTAAMKSEALAPRDRYRVSRKMGDMLTCSDSCRETFDPKDGGVVVGGTNGIGRVLALGSPTLRRCLATGARARSWKTLPPRSRPGDADAPRHDRCSRPHSEPAADAIVAISATSTGGVLRRRTARPGRSKTDDEGSGSRHEPQWRGASDKVFASRCSAKVRTIIGMLIVSFVGLPRSARTGPEAGCGA